MPMGTVDIVSRALCRYPDIDKARERELNSVSCYAIVSLLIGPEENGE